MAGTYHSENAILVNLFNGGVMTTPSNWYLGLGRTSSVPQENGSGFTEPAVGAYARVQVGNNTSNFNVPSSGQLQNITAINFPESTAAWGTIGYIGFFDAPTGGNLWFWESITVKDIVVNTTIIFAANSITIRMLNSN